MQEREQRDGDDDPEVSVDGRVRELGLGDLRGTTRGGHTPSHGAARAHGVALSYGAALEESNPVSHTTQL